VYPFLDAPVATYVPTDTVAHVTAVSGFCILDGFNIPFTATQLAPLYRNHGAYVSRFAQDAATLVRNGFWLTRTRARRSVALQTRPCGSLDDQSTED
jgi:hypothetical protein